MEARETLLFGLLFVASSFPAVQSSSEYEQNILFYRFIDSNKERFLSTFNSSIADQGCDLSANFTIIVHGYMENITSPWIDKTIKQFLLHRGGCVFVIDYSKFGRVSNYFNLVRHFEGIANVLTNKLIQIGNYDRQHCFGFSFGARLCIEAGISIGNQSIQSMELCDPAGVGFDGTKLQKVPKLAAKNVICINTSVDKGTSIYNCHRNFRMGYCGRWQPARGARPLGSHGLCPYFYNESFDYEYVSNNIYKCSSKRSINITTPVRMGYLGIDQTSLEGDIFIATAKYSPYVVLDNKIDNKPPKKP